MAGRGPQMRPMNILIFLNMINQQNIMLKLISEGGPPKLTQNIMLMKVAHLS